MGHYFLDILYFRIGVHVRSNMCYLICSRYLVRSGAVTILFSEKTYISSCLSNMVLVTIQYHDISYVQCNRVFMCKNRQPADGKEAFRQTFLINSNSMGGGHIGPQCPFTHNNITNNGDTKQISLLDTVLVMKDNKKFQLKKIISANEHKPWIESNIDHKL